MFGAISEARLKTRVARSIHFRQLLQVVWGGCGCVVVWLCCVVVVADFGPLVPTEMCFNPTAYLSITADHVHPNV